MVTQHVLNRIKQREINLDLEMVEYFCQKFQSQDTAVILGEVQFLNERNYVILIIRDGSAITIELRRKSQHCDENSLQVDLVVKFPCLF